MVIVYVGILAIIFGVFCLIKPLGHYLCINSPEIIWTFFFTLIATFAGVFLAVSLESSRDNEFEANIFKRSFAAITVEANDSESKIEALRNNTVTTFNILNLNTVIVNSVLANPLLYKYAGQEYWGVLEGYIGTVEILNKTQDILLEKRKSNGVLTKDDLEHFKKVLEQAGYYIAILKMQTSFYTQIYNVRGFQPGNYQEVMDLLNTYGDRKAALDKINSRIKEFENMSESRKKEIREDFKKVISD